jgi:hypothetical protein
VLTPPCAGRNQRTLRQHHHATGYCLPTAASYWHTEGSADTLRDVMGSFRFAGINSLVLNPGHVGSANRNRWPEVPWRRCTSPACPSQILRSPYLFPASPSSSPSPPRATSRHTPDRASESIQRTSLTRTSGTTSILRRWMLPTVERGPPVALAFERRSRSPARAGSRGI